MNKAFDKIIEMIKWPIAIWMLISLPAFIQSLSYFNFMSVKFFALGCGFFIFFMARTMADASIKANMQTIAHEMTHTFFAFITFHKVKHIRLNPDDTGGSMEFEGEGNWLIIIAPYFFPLFAFGVMLIIPIYTLFAPMNFIINGIIGYVLGYHLDTVTSQINEKQTDLPKVSYKFCWMFLPGANLWVIGSILAFNSKAWDGFWVYQKLIKHLNYKNMQVILELF